LGIDFGTSQAAAAVAVKGKLAMVPSEGLRPTIPSVVGIPAAAHAAAAGATADRPDRPLVGTAADALAVRHPERVVTAVKRLFGRKLETPEVRRHLQDVAYEVVAARNGDARVRVGRRHYAPPDLAAYVIESLKAAAERQLGVPVRDAVMAVPAHFHDLQRQALRDAMRIAGLEVLGAITEPTAAALGAGLLGPAARGDDRKVLVYDFGGGSFDVAAVHVKGDEVEVVASGGDAFLGGEDFDHRIVAYVRDHVQKACGVDLRGNRAMLARLRGAAEAAKQALSEVDLVEIPIAELAGAPPLRRAREGGGGKTPPPVVAGMLPPALPLTRARLESLTQDLIDRTVWPCEGVLRDAGWTAEQLDAVLLCGGQTRMPRVRAQIGELLGKTPIETAAPETLVALGAARQGAALTKQLRGAAALVVGEAACLSLAVETAGGVATRLIPKGTPLPATRSQVFSTATEGQTQIVVHLLQGEREMAADNESVARLVLGPLAPRPRGDVQVEVTIESDGSGLPRASARDLARGDARPVRLRPSGGLTESEVVALAAAHAGRPIPGAPVDAVMGEPGGDEEPRADDGGDAADPSGAAAGRRERRDPALQGG
jgi:molecular chaperone DnaK